MLTTPKRIYREQQPYVAIRTTVNMKDIPSVLPPLIPEVYAWLAKNNIRPDGPSFFQYLSINKNNELLTEVGVTIAEEVKGDGRVIAGRFPAGVYASLTYTGDYRHMKEAHMALESWVKEKGWKEKAQAVENGQQRGSRTEFYLTDPQTEPDPAKWQTDIMLLLEGDTLAAGET